MEALASGDDGPRSTSGRAVPEDFLADLKRTGPPSGSPTSTQDALGAVDLDLGPPEVPGFRILRELGRGGMGVVYEAIELPLNRRVALKVLPSILTSHGLAAERFRREARSAARLHHTNIVPIFGVGPGVGVLYYAMQLIDGESLDRVIARLRGSSVDDEATTRLQAPAGPRGLRPDDTTDEHARAVLPGPGRDREAARIGLQVAQALAYAHEQGILHRDIKPANLMIDARGVTWVTDFGLAKAFDADGDDLTASGDVVGTLRFLAPERFAGRSDPRSDIYALGITLYELLTLRPAFEGADRARLLEQVLQGELRHPRQIDRGISRDLETVVLKAIARDPGRRYASAADLAEDLRRFLAGETVSARRAGPAVRVWRWARRRPVAATLTLSVVLLLASLGAIAAMAAVRINQARDQLRHSLYVSRMNLAGLAWNSANMGRLRDLLRPYEDGSPDAMLRGFEWAYWRGLAHPKRHRATLKGHTRHVVSLAYSPEGSALASIGEENSVRVTDLKTGILRWSAGTDSMAYYKPLAWSPLGDLVATEGPDRSVVVRDAATGVQKHRLLNPGPESRLTGMAFAPDGDLIAVHGFTRVDRWTLATDGHATIHPATEVEGPDSVKLGTCQEMSRDGRTMAVGDDDGSVTIWDLASGRKRGRIAAHASAVRSLAFSPDGATLATGGQDTLIRLWDLGRLAPLCGPLQGHAISPWMLDFSPDGKTLASACLDNTVRLWDARTGSPLGVIRGHDAAVYCVRFASDGRTFATAGLDREIRVWDVDDPPPPTVLAADPIGGDALRFLPDGRMLASANRDLSVKLWDTRLGGPPRLTLGLGQDEAARSSVPGVDRRALGLDISPADGRTLAVARLNGMIELWDAVEGRLTVKPQRGPGAMHSVAFSPDGRLLATSGPLGVVTIRDPKTAVAQRTLRGGTGTKSTRSVGFTPDGSLLISVDQAGAVTFWNTSDWNRTGPDPTPDVAHVDGSGRLAISRDGSTFAVVLDDGSTNLWDVASRRPRLRLTGHGGQVLCATSRPTAGPWPPPAATAPSSSGTRPPAN